MNIYSQADISKADGKHILKVLGNVISVFSFSSLLSCAIYHVLGVNGRAVTLV